MNAERPKRRDSDWDAVATAFGGHGTDEFVGFIFLSILLGGASALGFSLTNSYWFPGAYMLLIWASWCVWSRNLRTVWSALPFAAPGLAVVWLAMVVAGVGAFCRDAAVAAWGEVFGPSGEDER